MATAGVYQIWSVRSLSIGYKICLGLCEGHVPQCPVPGDASVSKTNSAKVNNAARFLNTNETAFLNLIAT